MPSWNAAPRLAMLLLSLAAAWSLHAAKTLTGIDTFGFISCAGHATLAGCVPLGPFTTYVDDFTLIRKSDPPPVPEPATFWLAGGAAAALWLGRRRFA